MRRRVHYYLQRELRWSSLHFTLIDPEKQEPKRAGEIARWAQDAGSHAILVGGSTGVDRSNLDATVKSVKDHASVPVILFPGSREGISAHADAVFFMSMLNSQSAKYLVEEQAHAVHDIESMGLEVLPMGYVIVSPGGKVGEVGKARPIPRDRPDEAVRYALAAQFFGMKYVYLEAGSGASEPVPAAMIQEVSKRIDVPLIVGGGIRDAPTARRLVEAGADIIVTGNVIEGDVDVQKTIGAIIRESIEALRKKIREAV